MNRDFADLSGFHEFTRRAARNNKRLADGALGGATDLASPLSPPQAANQPRIVESTGGKEYATLVVAASNSTDHGKAGADYVCDGTADQVEILAALGALTVGGSVVLLEGEYHTTADINVTGDRLLRGQGRGTLIVRDAIAGFTNIIAISDDSCVSDLALRDDTGAAIGVFAFGNESMVLRTLIQDCQQGIWFNGNDQIAAHNHIRDCLVAGIFYDGSDRSTLVNNVVIGGADGIFLSTDNADVLGNQVMGSGGSGIKVWGSHSLLNGNRVSGVVGHGVSIEGGADIAVIANYVTSNGDATHDNINLDGASSCNVQGNTCRASLVTRYGIRVEAGSIDNFVTNNDLLNGGVTGNFSDVGVGTVTVAGNRV